MSNRYTIERQEYRIPLTDQRWFILRTIEDSDQDNIEDQINSLLGSSPLFDVEYSGHFGSNFYFKLNNNDFHMIDSIVTLLFHLLDDDMSELEMLDNMGV